MTPLRSGKKDGPGLCCPIKYGSPFILFAGEKGSQADGGRDAEKKRRSRREN